jgi:hypothetical protein
VAQFVASLMASETGDVASLAASGTSDMALVGSVIGSVKGGGGDVASGAALLGAGGIGVGGH